MRKISFLYNSFRVFTLASLLTACGTNLGSDFLEDGESLERGSTASVSIPIEFYYQDADQTCRGIPASTDESACTRRLEVGVLLPQGISYAGEPEARVEVRDVVAGENAVPEPVVYFCQGSGYQVLHFSIPPMVVDLDGEDSSIVEDIIDDILDSASEQFTFKVRGESAGAGGEIYFAQRLSDFSPSDYCPPTDRAERLISVLVK